MPLPEEPHLRLPLFTRPEHEVMIDVLVAVQNITAAVAGGGQRCTDFVSMYKKVKMPVTVRMDDC